jgi:outer membrane protein
MNRSFATRTLTAVALAAALVPAASAQTAGAKIGVIDVQRILTESVAGKQAMGTLKGLQDQKLTEAKAKQDEINQLRARINDGRLSLAEDKIAEMEKQAEDKVIAFRRFQDDADRDLQKARDVAFDAIEKRVLPLINQIGNEGGYTVIFNKFQSGLIYADDKVDLTAEVIKRFDATPAAAAPKGT